MEHTFVLSHAVLGSHCLRLSDETIALARNTRMVSLWKLLDKDAHDLVYFERRWMMYARWTWCNVTTTTYLLVYR